MYKIFIIAIFMSSNVWAGSSQIGSSDDPSSHLCLQGEYSDEYLAQHPEQRLSIIQLLVTPRIPKSNTLPMSATMVGLTGGNEEVTWLNDLYDCEYQKNGSLICGVDCDGGTFVLLPQLDGTSYQIAPLNGGYFQLFHYGTGPNNRSEKNRMRFDSFDKGGSIFKDVKIMPASSCDPIKTFKTVKSRGC